MSDPAEPNMKTVVIIGAGPAGLTAAYQLLKRDAESIVVERDSVVGGISKTANFNGYLFDLGGHRFFSKIKAAENMWKEVLEKDLLVRQRLSRIFYNKKFFYYPLRPTNALLGLGIWNSALIFVSYCYAHLFPIRNEETFEQWVTNRFGKRLYNTFFKTYTEKVWGIPCSEIRAEWAAQRIQGLSLKTALKNALVKNNKQNGRHVIRTLIDTFEYPKFGPGMMWQKVSDLVAGDGNRICLDAELETLLWDPEAGRITAAEISRNGKKEVIHGTDFISSMPIKDLIHRMRPPVPHHVLEAAGNLRYRDFLTVALIVNKTDLFPDNWIYIHDPSVKVGRVQNFKNWSPFMVPDPSKSSLGLEYFCFEGDELWSMKDEELIELGKQEMAILGLLRPSDVEGGTVVRVPKAYPAYDSQYREMLKIVRQFLGGIGNLQLVGRNGMHRYNNQDHSMQTAMLAVENIFGAHHDLWKVNVEREYHEEKIEEAAERIPDEALARAFARLDKLGFATAIGTIAGLMIMLATLAVLMKGDFTVRLYAGLLAQYFPGYEVTPKGAFIGFGFGFTWGFLFGWLFAYLRNASLAFYIYRVKRKSELMSFRDFLDQY
jgi:protoporphyrinogen oxidase